MYYLYLLGRWFSSTFPRRICYAVADFISTVKLAWPSKDKKIVAENLFPVLGDKNRARQCASRVVRNFSYYLVDFLRFGKINPAFVRKYVTIEGRDYLDELVSRNKKIILITAHLGNYELGGAVISSLGYKLCVLALPHRDRRVNAFFNAQRNACGVDVAQTGAGVKKCLKALNKGAIIAMVGDKNFFGQGSRVGMFGQQCVMPRGPVAISLRTGAYILPVLSVREGKYNYRFIFSAPLSPYGGGQIKSETMLMGECARVLSEFISRYPDQWYMFEPYWLK